jgi:hypothetical protein
MGGEAGIRSGGKATSDVGDSRGGLVEALAKFVGVEKTEATKEGFRYAAS